MDELNESNAADYARSRGLFPLGTDVHVEFLTGGVSNVVLRLRAVDSGRELVLKQARAKLRVAIDWHSRLDRVWREVLTLRVIEPLLPTGAVPAVVFEDRDQHAFAMTAAPRSSHVWKQELLAGRLEPGLTRELGQRLAGIHSLTWEGKHLPDDLRRRDVFDELRIDPYYRWVAARDPAMRPALTQLSEQALGRSDCLTLADFSPKNILLAPGRTTLIDFETAHLGDPAFDLGFFLTHLVLKSLHVRPLRERLLVAIDDFWNAYRSGFSASVPSGPGTETAMVDIEKRTGPHLAACLLARVDGKSPVDYLTPDEQTQVRRFARSVLPSPPSTWKEFREEIVRTLHAAAV